MSNSKVTLRRLRAGVAAGVAATALFGAIATATPAYANDRPEASTTTAADYTCADPGVYKGEQDWFGRPQSAYMNIIHKSERPDSTRWKLRTKQVLVNWAYRNVSQEKVTLVNGVKYLWLVNEDNSLITGIEDAADYPQAFQPGVTDYIKSRKLGHPTLAVKFTKEGKSVEGKGRIAGEMYQIDGKWTIDNNSGRYSRGRSSDEDQKVLVSRAAQEFKKHGITVQCKSR